MRASWSDQGEPAGPVRADFPEHASWRAPGSYREAAGGDPARRFTEPDRRVAAARTHVKDGEPDEADETFPRPGLWSTLVIKTLASVPGRSP